MFTAFAAADTTSVDTVSYKSNSEFFDGEVLQAGYVSNFATDKINVHLGASEIESKTGATAEEDLTLSVSHQNTYARYPLQETGLKKIYGWEGMKKTFDTKDQLWNWVTSNCADFTEGGVAIGDRTSKVEAAAKSWYDYWTGSYNYQAFCLRKNGYYGDVADIGSPDEIFRTEWRLQAGDKNPQTAIITNGDGGSGVVSNLGRYAKVKWQGNLDTGQNPPLVDDELAIHGNNYEGGWRVISEQRYDNYWNYIKNDGNRLLDKWKSGDYSESYIEGLLNGKAENAQKRYSESPLANAEVLDSSFQSGALKADMDSRLAYPEFNVYVDAGENGYITVSKPVGKPKIVSSSGASFGELSSGRISVDVKNVGGAEGSFSARAGSCSQYFQADALQNTKRVAPGETASYSFRVTFTSTSMQQASYTGRCSITVEDTGSGREVSTSVSVEATQQSECTQGKEIVKQKNGNDVIYSCPDGLKIQKQDTCTGELKAVFVNNDIQYDCREEGTGGGSGGGLFGKRFTLPITGTQLSNPLNAFENIWSGDANALNWLQVFVTFIAFLGGFALVGVKLGKIVDGLATEFIPVKDSHVRLVIGLLGGGMIATAVYQLVTDPLGLLVTVLGLVVMGYLYLSASAPEINL